MAICVLLALAAYWLNLTSLQQHHNADSLVPALMSIDYLTPFYWGQERVGAFSSVLVASIDDPLRVVLVRSWISIFCGMLALCGILAYLRVRNWGAKALVALIALLLILSPPRVFSFFVGQYLYGESLALGAGALLLLDQRRIRLLSARGVAGLALLLLAHWVNLAVMGALLPIVVMRALLQGSFKRHTTPRQLTFSFAKPSLRTRLLCRLEAGSSADLSRVVVAILLAWATNILFARIYQSVLEGPLGIPATDFGFLSPGRWPEALGALFAETWKDFGRQRLVVALSAAVVLGVVSWLWRGSRELMSEAGRAAGVLLASAFAYTCLVAANAHVALNAFNSRYMTLPLALAILGASCFASPLVEHGLGVIATRLPLELRRYRAGPASVVVLIGAIGALYGWPQTNVLSEHLERNWGALTREARAVQCTHLLGSYWTVWPSIFLSRVMDQKTGKHRPLWGLTHRGKATEHQWRLRFPDSALRICVPHDTSTRDRRFFRAHFKLPPLFRASRYKRIDLFLPTVHQQNSGKPRR
ncbi:MAG: hypothetical protein CSA65_03950 [Proteobacteria bacterium]|nr:MAG: hypothetical protein CSA65_03950 [Pseudomonadota bacterium]